MCCLSVFLEQRSELEGLLIALAGPVQGWLPGCVCSFGSLGGGALALLDSAVPVDHQNQGSWNPWILDSSVRVTVTLSLVFPSIELFPHWVV